MVDSKDRRRSREEEGFDGGEEGEEDGVRGAVRCGAVSRVEIEPAGAGGWGCKQNLP